MGAKVIHWEISSNDHAKAREFYSKLFDWEMQSHEGMDYSLVPSGGEGSIGGGIGPVTVEKKPTVTFYVLVDELEPYLKKAEELGGKTLQPPTPIPNIGSSALFTDPDGNIIGLFKGLDK